MEVFSILSKRIKSLADTFQLTRPVEIKKGNGQEVICYPEKHVIVIDKGTKYQDLAELVAVCKLGEKDVLLATLFFQRNLSEQEEKFAMMFANITYPLRMLWTYRVMNRYLPEGEFTLEVNELIEMLSFLQGRTVTDTELPISPFHMTAVAMTLEEFSESRIEMKTNKEWENYVNALRDLKDREKAESFIELAKRIDAPYSVTIEDEPYRHFYILS